MPEIRDIGINNVGVSRIQIRDLNVERVWLDSPSQAIPVHPPVVVDIGTPIVNVPGCVEAHQEKGKSKGIIEDDENGVVTYCDSGVPSFNPIDYNPEEMTITTSTPPPKVDPPESPEVPKPEVPKDTKIPTCPTEAQELKEPVGTLVEGGTKKIVEYRLVGKECIPVKEDIKIPDQIIQAIPTAGSITTTASIAVVATTSALLAKPLADLLLKVVKPTVKKIIKKITTLRGKQVKIESLKERRDQQRIRSHAIRKLKGKE